MTQEITNHAKDPPEKPRERRTSYIFRGLVGYKDTHKHEQRNHPQDNTQWQDKETEYQQ